MSLENVRIVEVITTAYEEENFILLTDLSDEQIENVIRPIVEKERDAESLGSNSQGLLRESTKDRLLRLLDRDGLDSDHLLRQS